jgi:hypothetical protein
VRTVRYEDVRATPGETLRAALDHCGLPAAAAVSDRLAGGVRAPSTTPADLSAADRAVVAGETGHTAARWGY